MEAFSSAQDLSGLLETEHSAAPDTSPNNSPPTTNRAGHSRNPTASTHLNASDPTDASIPSPVPQPALAPITRHVGFAEEERDSEAAAFATLHEIELQEVLLEERALADATVWREADVAAAAAARSGWDMPDGAALGYSTLLAAASTMRISLASVLYLMLFLAHCAVRYPPFPPLEPPPHPPPPTLLASAMGEVVWSSEVRGG